MKAIIFVLALIVSSFASAQQVAGVIKNTEGTVEIVRKGVPVAAKAGDKIYEGDTIKTGKDSNAGIMLKDESRMATGSNSQVALDKFKFNPDTNNGNIAINVIKGTFAMISGLLVKHNPETATVKTPTSTAGIRGTYFVVEVP